MMRAALGVAGVGGLAARRAISDAAAAAAAFGRRWPGPCRRSARRARWRRPRTSGRRGSRPAARTRCRHGRGGKVAGGEQRQCPVDGDGSAQAGVSTPAAIAQRRPGGAGRCAGRPRRGRPWPGSRGSGPGPGARQARGRARIFASMARAASAGPARAGRRASECSDVAARGHRPSAASARAPRRTARRLVTVSAGDPGRPERVQHPGRCRSRRRSAGPAASASL